MATAKRSGHHPVRTLAAVLFVGALGASVGTTFVPAQAQQASGGASTALGRSHHVAQRVGINTSSRAAVAAAWRSQWVPNARVIVSATGGSTDTCTPFVTSAATLNATRSAINFARALSGVAPVTSVADTSRDAARSALILAANRMLTHTPGTSSRCYTAAGARTAKRSNIGLWASNASDWRPSVGQIVAGYLTDPGADNVLAAHRIWLLRAAARSLPVGFAVSRAGGWTWVANDIIVLPSGADVRGGAKFHSWPAKGYFPLQLEPAGRWSLSSPNPRISFKRAHVRVTRNGKTVALARTKWSNSIGDHSLIWQLRNRPSAGTYCVRVTGIAGSAAYSYCTRLFRA